MFPRRHIGRSSPRSHDGEPPWQEGREFGTGERSPLPAFLEPFPVQRRMERPRRVSSPSGCRDEGYGFTHGDLPERPEEYWREGEYRAGPRFVYRDWPAPSEEPMVRRRVNSSPERGGEYSNCKRRRVLDMERGRGDDFGLSSRFLPHSSPRYNERHREMHHDLSRARNFEGARPWAPPVGRRWCRGSPTPGRQFLESDWPSPAEPHTRPRPQDLSRRRPIDHGDGFGMQPAYFELSRHAPMEHGRERSPPRILEDMRAWTPPPLVCERRWGGLSQGSDGQSRRFLENREVYGWSPPGAGRFAEGFGPQGPHSWREEVNPPLPARLIPGRHLHSAAAVISGGGGGGGGTLPRRFVSERGGSGRLRSPRPRSKKQGIAADPPNSAPIEEAKPHVNINEASSLVGICEDTQKGFFRLTGPADPSKVRPKPILLEALKLLELSEREYSFKTDQLKAIRQDLSVQNIEDDFSVQVYELHARLALANNDIPELNVCLTRLQELYRVKLNAQSGEFLAYDILLCATQGRNLELMSKLGRLQASLKQDAAVKHAQKVTQSIRSGNYVQFFKLYKSAPNMNGQLMGLSFEKMRFEALKCMTKAYAQKVPLAYVVNLLGFDGVQETMDWLQRHGAVTCSESKALLPKESAPLLRVPDPVRDDASTLESLHTLRKFPTDDTED